MISLWPILRQFFIPLLVLFGQIHNNSFAAERVSKDSLQPLPYLTNHSLSDSLSFVLPFSRAGNLILIQAKADSIEGNFILDTGCPHLVLNHTYFRHYPISEAAEERTGITGSEFSASSVLIREFSLGGMRYDRIKADLANLGNIENTKGVRILGLIGMQLLNRFELILDYDKNLIYFHLISRKEASVYSHAMLKDTSVYNVIPIEMIDQRIMIRGELSGKKIRLIIDSGAETNMLDSRLPSKIFENVTITGKLKLSGAGDTKIEVLRGDLNALKIGNESFESMPVLIANLEKTCFSYGGCVDGILGFDFLSLRKLGFNFVTGKMYIWK
jgi:predicted aspartyl protease